MGRTRPSSRPAAEITSLKLSPGPRSDGQPVDNGEVILCVAPMPKRRYRESFSLGTLWSLLEVLRLHAEKFLKAHHFMSQLEYAAMEFRSGKVLSVDPAAAIAILQTIDNLIPLLDELELSLSAATARELRDYFDKNRVPPALGLGGDLARRIHDELALEYCLVLSPRERSYYDNANPPFRPEVTSVNVV